MKGVIKTRPMMPVQVRACRPDRGQPSGSSPRVIVSVSRGGVRSACAVMEIHSPRCLLIPVSIALGELTRAD